MCRLSEVHLPRGRADGVWRKLERVPTCRKSGRINMMMKGRVNWASRQTAAVNMTFTTV
jgi:hypothetical protein